MKTKYNYITQRTYDISNIDIKSMYTHGMGKPRDNIVDYGALYRNAKYDYICFGVGTIISQIILFLPKSVTLNGTHSHVLTALCLNLPVLLAVVYGWRWTIKSRDKMRDAIIEAL